MALPKKGSRLLVVDGQKYRWSVRRNDDDTGWNAYGMATTLTIAVENYENPQSLLSITWEGGFRYGYPDEPPHSVTTGEEMKITPNQVADWIRQSLKQGWNPEAKAATFCVSL